MNTNRNFFREPRLQNLNMKTPNCSSRAMRLTKVQGIVFALLFFSLTVTTSWAHGPSVRKLSGVVQTIDLSHRQIIFIINKDARTMTFALDRHTRYVRDGYLVTAEALKEGTSALLCYRTPFFGRRILTKVVWETH